MTPQQIHLMLIIMLNMMLNIVMLFQQITHLVNHCNQIKVVLCGFSLLQYHYAEGGNGFIEVEWTEPGVITCSDEVIPSLPFNTIGSNVGMGDDWLVQGSQGADYSYFLNVTSPIVIDITLCSSNTNYDTKLEIFTADPDCNETTTGNYIDDFTCEFNGLYSSLYGVSCSQVNIILL